MDLLLIFLENKSHYVYIKDFNRFMFSKSKKKNKKYFRRYCLQYFSSESILVKHKENCLIINGKQCVKLDKGSIGFKNYSRQIPISFKIYADFECILKETNVSEEITNGNSSYTKKYQNHIPCGFGYKVICVDNRFSKDVVVYRGKDCINKFITMILKEYEYCSGVIKKYFNKNLVMTLEEEEIFEIRNIRDHCHILGKFRGAAHFSCNLKISKKVPVIFHNLRGYDSHLIMGGISNLDVKVDVIPNGLEK